VAPSSPSVAELRDLRERLAHSEWDLPDAELIEVIAALEELKSGCAAAQAVATARFDASQRAAQAAEGVRSDKLGVGVAGQIGLARRESPSKGAQHVGLAKALVGELPHTLAALARGQISEWRAKLVARETAALPVELRAEVDAALAERLPDLGDAGVVREAKKLACRLDPASQVRRARKAEADRRVTIRPAPDTMAYVTALLPVAEGVAVYAALSRHADSNRSAGDTRGRGQIMADTLVERVTGQASAPDVPVEIELVMTDATLLGGDSAPGHLVGHGPVPAATARHIVGGRLGRKAKAWVRRLYTAPDSGEIVAMDSRRRRFDGELRHLLVLRDQFCRTPWCDAPIRHVDHVERAADGGDTSHLNGQGLCEACNYAKEAPGWVAVADEVDGRHTVTTRTPTGHTYTSAAPDPPGPSRAAPFSQQTERSQSSPSPSASRLAS